MNEVYRSTPVDEGLYQSKTLPLSEIYTIMIERLTFFNVKTKLFASFCSKYYIGFMENESVSPKRLKNQNGRYAKLYNVYILNERYHGKVKMIFFSQYLLTVNP
jgi:hypothetical protein